MRLVQGRRLVEAQILSVGARLTKSKFHDFKLIVIHVVADVAMRNLVGGHHLLAGNGELVVLPYAVVVLGVDEEVLMVAVGCHAAARGHPSYDGAVSVAGALQLAGAEVEAYKVAGSTVSASEDAAQRRLALALHHATEEAALELMEYRPGIAHDASHAARRHAGIEAALVGAEDYHVVIRLTNDASHAPAVADVYLHRAAHILVEAVARAVSNASHGPRNVGGFLLMADAACHMEVLDCGVLHEAKHSVLEPQIGITRIFNRIFYVVAHNGYGVSVAVEGASEREFLCSAEAVAFIYGDVGFKADNKHFSRNRPLY